MSDNALELGVAVVTQGLYDISSQKKHFAFRWAVNRMTIVTDERQVAVMAREMKCCLFVGIPASRFMAFQTQPVSEREPQ